MIVGIGTDIIEIKRVERLINNTKFMERFFTEVEREYLENRPVESAAGYFCAKEAIVKALGTGFSGFKWTDVEIFKDGSAPRPRVRLYGNALRIAENKNISITHVSISHCREYATATAVAEG